jgi:putative glycosyltransferase
MRISLVTPLYKSAPYIEELYTRAVATITDITPDYEIVFVNDASPDDSLSVAVAIAKRDDRVRVVDLSQNYGQHPALLAGLQEATGHYVFICDSDLEDEPEWLGSFYARLQSAGCDVVYGVMTNKNGSLPYRAMRALFYFALRLLSGVPIPVDVVPARIMSRRFVNAMLSFNEHEIFLLGLYYAPGFKQEPYPVRKIDRSPSTYTLPKLIKLFVNGILSFSIRPLAAIAVIGLTMSLAAFFLAGYFICRIWLFGQSVPGWASTITSLMMIGGLTIFLNGVVALYVAKIYIEVKRRPVAIVREIFGSALSGGASPKRMSNIVRAVQNSGDLR